MCELCENNHMDEYGRKIVKENNKYIIQKWKALGYEIDDTYELIASMEITNCPDCNKLLI